jgi:hypothetical protein
MTTATARWLAGGLLLLTVAALTVSAWFGVANGDLMNAFAFTPLLLAFAAVGAIVASHRPANPIGWLFQAEGLGFAVGVATDALARHAITAGTAPSTVAWADWLGAIGGELGFLFVLAVLLFPDGRLPSPRWRVVAWLIIAGEALLVLMAVASSAALRAQISAVRVSPVRLIPDAVADPVVNVVQTAFLPLFVAAAAGLAVRYRRATPDVRHQIKWVAYASLLTAAAMLFCGLVFSDPLGALLGVGPLIPVAAGIAIFKYRLYDIDVVISKTIVYGSLAAFITLVYVVIVAGIGSLGSGVRAGRVAAGPGPVDPGDRGGGGGLPAGQGAGAAAGQPAGVRQAGHPLRGAQRVHRPDGRDLRHRGRPAADGPGPGRGHRRRPRGGVAEGRRRACRRGVLARGRGATRPGRVHGRGGARHHRSRPGRPGGLPRGDARRAVGG